MPEWLYKLIDNYLPELIDRSRSTQLLHWAFWVTTLFMAALIITANPVFGWFVLGAPVLLVGQTRRHGIGGVNRLLLVAAAVLALVPAFFLGQSKASTESPTGLGLVGFMVLLVWVAAFPAILGKLDERYRRSVLPPGRAIGQLPVDGWGGLRLLRIRLWIATVIMLVAGEEVAAVVCAFALVSRHRWTASWQGSCASSSRCCPFGVEVSSVWERGADRLTYR